ncbi:hypothetical protein JG688_00018186 [Phytophthora aleatoria]|uniref:MULE transposase domain-containing protein n=1 Tax=Phytophthora aleatoria TaxID=2496075 RepID=A0A8J5LUW5_9STRA|nr:hypothetical protein JG688_00018186 [Phytophthora aleatoria]
MAGQLQADSKLVCSRNMLYRVKEAVLRELFAEDEKSIEYLPRYLSVFCDRNQGTIANLERDNSGNFSRALVALDPAWFSCGQAIFGVDAAHMKHRLYNGVQIVLVGRDGNFQNRVAAVALAPLEDHANYLWFSRSWYVMDFRSEMYVFLIIEIISASRELNLLTKFCTRHLIGKCKNFRMFTELMSYRECFIGNMRTDKKGGVGCLP